MANGNGHSSNGSKDYWGPVFKQIGGLGVAELGSIGVSLGVVAVADGVDKLTGGLINNASKVVSRTVIEPYLDYLEKGLDSICQLEECKVPEGKTRQERADRLARNLIVFTGSFIAGMGSKMALRKVCDHMTGVSPPVGNALPGWRGVVERAKFWKSMSKGDWLVFAMDEGTHIGSLLTVNTGVAKNTDDMIRTTTDMLTKMGVSKEKAHELATYSLVWELPNILGFGAGVGGIMIANKLGWNHSHGSHTNYSTPA